MATELIRSSRFLFTLGVCYTNENLISEAESESEVGLLHQSTKQKKYKHNLIETKYDANGFGRSEACLSPNPFGQY